MFETLNRLYRDKSIGIEQLENAVTKGWITWEEKTYIESIQKCMQEVY